MMVASRTMLSSTELNSLFDYNPEDGVLRWKYQSSRGKDWNKQRAGKPAGSTKADGYMQVGFNGRVMYYHRIVWAMMSGECPDGSFIDHIDGDRSNNRISNLRLASISENNANAKIHKSNKSGIKGVSWAVKPQKWHAAIVFQKKSYFVGQFSKLEDAANAMRMAREKVHGEFARFA